MSTSKRPNREHIGIYLSPVNKKLLEVISENSGVSKSDLMRYALSKAYADPKWAEEEFRCPGLALEVQETINEVKRNKARK